MSCYSRREFIKSSAFIAGSTILGNSFTDSLFGSGIFNDKVPLSGELWVYASEFPPHWDCTPIMDQVFEELSSAGLQGVEVMAQNLRHHNAVSHLKSLSKKYNFPVTGSSYGAHMWDRSKHREILNDVELIVSRLHKLGGNVLGIDVGNADHVKTHSELDAQADILEKVIRICKKNQVQPNLHNHIYQVKNNMYDLKETLKRVPYVKLGPDLGWLKKAGVDPVKFIKTYRDQIVYMHIRDIDADGQWAKVVGEGIMDWPAIVEVFDEVGFDGSAAIELAFPKPPPRGKNLEKYWEKSRRFVRNTFGW